MPRILVALLLYCLIDHGSGTTTISEQQQQLRTTTAPPSTASSNTINATIPSAISIIRLHAASGTQHVRLYVGQPIQTQILIVDTGSRFTSWKCHPCADCGASKQSSYYNPQSSTTMQPIFCGQCQWTGRLRFCGDASQQCTILQKYTEGSSWTGHEVNDVVAFESRLSQEQAMEWLLPFTFGCQTSVTGLFRKQYADGILGLERSEHSLTQQMKREGLLQRDAFSLCMGREGGYLGLGGALTQLHWNEKMRATPIVRQHGMFAVKVVEFWLGDQCLLCGGVGDGAQLLRKQQTIYRGFNNGKGTILDSGTTDSYLPASLANSFAKTWHKLTGLHYEKQRVHKYTYDEYKALLPTITIVLDANVTITVPPLHYMENADSGASAASWPRELTNRIYVDEPEGAVLGLNVQRGYDILYDSDGNQVGFARADCDKQQEMKRTQVAP